MMNIASIWLHYKSLPYTCDIFLLFDELNFTFGIVKAGKKNHVFEESSLVSARSKYVCKLLYIVFQLPT